MPKVFGLNKTRKQFIIIDETNNTSKEEHLKRFENVLNRSKLKNKLYKVITTSKIYRGSL